MTQVLEYMKLVDDEGISVWSSLVDLVQVSGQNSFLDGVVLSLFWLVVHNCTADLEHVLSGILSYTAIKPASVHAFCVNVEPLSLLIDNSMHFDTLMSQHLV